MNGSLELAQAIALVLTVCLPVSDQCSEHLVAEYYDPIGCLQDKQAMDAETNSSKIYKLDCIAVDTE